MFPITRPALTTWFVILGISFILPRVASLTTFDLHPNGNTTLCVKTKGDQYASGVALIIDLCVSGDGGGWSIQRDQTSITDDGGAFSFDAGDSPKNGTPMKIWKSYPGIPAQNWYYTDDNRIALTGSGLCLDLTNGNMTPGTPLQLWACTSGNTNQVWTTQSLRLIHPNGDANLCLYPSSDSNNVIVTSCNGASTNELGLYISLGPTSVVNDAEFGFTNSTKAANGVSIIAATVKCCPPHPYIIWYYTNDNRIALTGTGFCIDLTNGNHTSGQAVQLWSCANGNTNQIWTF